MFENYGTFDQEKVLKEEQVIREIKDVPPTLLVIVFNKIENLQDLAQAVFNPYKQVQLFNIGLQVLKESGAFTEGLKLWYAKPIFEHTWHNFKKTLSRRIKETKKSPRSKYERNKRSYS